MPSAAGLEVGNKVGLRAKKIRKPIVSTTVPSFAAFSDIVSFCLRVWLSVSGGFWKFRLSEREVLYRQLHSRYLTAS